MKIGHFEDTQVSDYCVLNTHFQLLYATNSTQRSKHNSNHFNHSHINLVQRLHCKFIVALNIRTVYIYLTYHTPHTLPTQVTEEEVVGTIQRLNEDPRVNAILLQLPLDSTNQIDADRCTNTIAVNKVLDIERIC